MQPCLLIECATVPQHAMQQRQRFQASCYAIDAEMMEQVRQISERVQPNYTFLVVDAMTGQDAVTTAEAFDQTLALDGVILSKLEWNKITPSERQVRDALSVAVVQWPTLDRAYLRRWAPELGVTEKLEEVLRTAEVQRRDSCANITAASTMKTRKDAANSPDWWELATRLVRICAA